jgi:YggT family protein
MQSIVYLLARLIDIYSLVIIVRAIISWVQPNPYNPIVQLLYRVTEPVLYPIRRVLFRYKGMRNTGIDFSPFIAIILLYTLKSILFRVL